MVARNSAPLAAPLARSWQAALRDAVRDPRELARLVELPEQALAHVVTDANFPLLVPRGYVARIRKGDPDDPLLRQILPVTNERDIVPGYSADPLDERTYAADGVLRKYARRALLITTAACPVHCRYCFRRSFPYATQLAARADFGPALHALRAATDIDEVILSGGDPLSLGNRRLAGLIRGLEEIPALRRVRIHTRFPIMLPERIDASLTKLLRATRLRTIVVVHANHAREIDPPVAAALRGLADSVDALLNQSVLLQGVNDSVDALVDLSEQLFAAATLPYYLHLLDPVAGAAHFAVPEHRALEIAAGLRARLPGYLVPRLVREIPGEFSKTPL
jgi:L-lysine 2,3-aminomutase